MHWWRQSSATPCSKISMGLKNDNFYAVDRDFFADFCVSWTRQRGIRQGSLLFLLHEIRISVQLPMHFWTIILQLSQIMCVLFFNSDPRRGASSQTRQPIQARRAGCKSGPPSRRVCSNSAPRSSLRQDTRLSVVEIIIVPARII